MRYCNGATLKPPDYYLEKNIGTWRYGLSKLYLLNGKSSEQRSSGAGVCKFKIDQPVKKYIARQRSNARPNSRRYRRNQQTITD